MNAAEQPQPLPWAKVSQHPDFQKAGWQTRQKMRNNYMEHVVRPLAKSEEDFARVRDQFFTATEPDVFGEGSYRQRTRIEDSKALNTGYGGGLAEQRALDSRNVPEPQAPQGLVLPEASNQEPSEPEGRTTKGWGANLGRATAEGAVGSIGAAVEGAGVIAEQAGVVEANRQVDDAIKRLETTQQQYEAALEGTNDAFRDDVEANYQRLLDDRADELHQAMTAWADREPSNAAQWLRDRGVDLLDSAEAIGPDDKYRGVATDLAGGLGSMLTYMGPGLLVGALTRGSSAAAMGTAVGMAGSSGVSEQYQRAKAGGLDEEAALEKAMQGFGAGAIQVAPLAAMIKPLPAELQGKAIGQLYGIMRAAGSEAVVEGAGAVMQNLIEQSYNPERGTWDDTAYQAAISGGSAGLLQAGVQVATRGRGMNASAPQRREAEAEQADAPQTADSDANAEWEAAWREQAAEDGITNFDPNTNIPDTTIDVEGQAAEVADAPPQTGAPQAEAEQQEMEAPAPAQASPQEDDTGARLIRSPAEQLDPMEQRARERLLTGDGYAFLRERAEGNEEAVAAVDRMQVLANEGDADGAADAYKEARQLLQPAGSAAPQAEVAAPQAERQPATEPALPPEQPSPNPDSKTPRRVPVESIQVDPQAYQFRTEVNEQGVDSRLEGIEKWDDLRAGNLILHERTDGSVYAADGHHRINLARQLQQPDVNAVVLREADGVTVEDARRAAAEANIAAGSATAMDAAKVFRNSDGDIDTVIRESNLPRTQLVRDGADIAKLDTEPFGSVLNKVITEKDGAVIGRSFSDPDQQLAAVGVFQRVKPTNDNQRELLANEVRQAGFAESQGEQGGLFGEDPAESLIGERVKVMDGLRQTLVRDKRLFATLNDNAKTAEQAGNRIAKDRNNALQETSAEAIALLERATTTPEINQQINDAARRVKEGETLASVTRELKEALLNGPNSTAASERRTPAPSSGQANQAGQDAGRSEPVPAVNDARTARAGEQRSRTGAGAQAEPAVTLKADGAPFQTRKAVELSKRFRDTSNAQPIEVDGGWGFISHPSSDMQANLPADTAEPPQLRDIKESIEVAATQTDLNPTQLQAEAGNYRKGRVKLKGLDIAIENPKGSTRRGTGADGTQWESQMAHHYGDIKGTKAADGDNLDVFVGDNPGSSNAYIIDQLNEEGSFDEHKIMLGFDSLEAAQQGYLANYEDGWQGLGEISEVSVDDLKSWIKEGDTQRPFALGENSDIDLTDREAVEAVAPDQLSNNFDRNDAQAADAIEQSLSDPAREPQASVTLKADGQPFQTRRAVELSKRYRNTQNAQPVEVEGGWGFAVQDAAQETANAVINEQKNTQALGSSDKGQGQAVNWQRRSKNSKVWNGSNGMVIADHGFSSGGNRVPMYMVFENRDAFDKGVQLATKDTLREAKQFAVTAERPTTQQSDDLTLETQTEESLAQREQEVQQAEQADADQRNQETQRAQADRDANDFVLSGSDRPNDIAESRGQSDIFSTPPSPEPATQTTESLLASKAAQQRKPKKLTPRQQLASNAFGGAIVGDTIKLATDVGYAKAGASYTVDSLNKDGTLQATNVERGSSVLISQGEWTQASRRTKAPIAEVTKAEQESGQSNQEAMYSLRSVVRGDGKEQGVKLEEAQRIADEFMADYNGNIPLDLMVVNRQEDAYGPAATRENVGVIKGAYHSGSGKLVLAAASLRDARDGRKTLRHEVVGHYGLNTFEPTVKRQILDRVLETQEVPSLRPAWDHVNQHYPADSTSADVRAEEVFAHLAERERGRFGAAWDGVLSQLNRAMRQAGLTKHPLSRAELHDLASTISKEIREGRRQQRTFPESDQASFQREQPAVQEISAEPQASIDATETALRNVGEAVENAQAAPRATDIAAALADTPELTNTSVIQSTTELPPSALIGMMLRSVNPADVRGMFIGNELYVIADNVVSVEEGVQTAIHEAVGHKGIRGVLGADLDPVMRQVYNSLPLDPRGREALNEVLESYPFLDRSNPEHQITIAEEMVAHLTEKGWRPNVLRRAVAKIRELLRRYFPSMNWTDADVMQLSERSREYLRREQQARDSEVALFSLNRPLSGLSAQDVAAQLREAHPGLKLDLMSKGGRATLSRIVVLDNGREEGTGTQVMQHLSRWADANGITLALTPSSDFGGNTRRLRDFYKRFGFIENKGKKRDFEISEGMYREPGADSPLFSLNNRGKSTTAHDVQSSLSEVSGIGRPTVLESADNLALDIALESTIAGVNPQDAIAFYHGDDLYVIAGNARDTAEAMRATIATVTGNKGLRATMGNRIDSTLLNVVAGAQKSIVGREALRGIRAEYDHLSINHTPDQVNLGAELVARMSELSDPPAFIQEASAKLDDLLQRGYPKAGFTAGDGQAMARQNRHHLQQQQRDFGEGKPPYALPYVFSAQDGPGRGTLLDMNTQVVDADGNIVSDARIDGPVVSDAKYGQGFFESATDRLRRSNSPVLQELAKRTDAYFDQAEARLGMVNSILREPLKRLRTLNPLERRRNMRDFESYMRHRDNGRDAEAQAVADSNAAVAELAEAVDTMFDQVGTINQTVKTPQGTGMRVFDSKTGAYRKIGKFKKGGFWPRALRPEVQRVMHDPTSNTKLWHELLDALVDEGRANTRKEAAEYLRGNSGYFSTEITSDYFAGIEKARGEKLPEMFYDYRFDVVSNYARKWSDRISQVEQFGQKIGPMGKDAFEEAATVARDQRTKDYIGWLADRAYNRRPTDAYHELMANANLAATGLQLGNPGTATLNIIGGTQLNVQMFGSKRMAKAYLDLAMDAKNIYREGVELGILGKDVLNILRDADNRNAEYMDANSKTKEWLGKFSAGTMKWGGYTGTEQIIRATGMIAARAQLMDALHAWNKRPHSRDARTYRKFMERNRIDVAKLLRENGKGEETGRYLRLMVNIPQGSYRVDQTPIYVDTPMGRFFFKYQKFGTQVSRLFWQQKLKPFMDVVSDPNATAMDRAHAFLPLLQWFGWAVAGGGAVLAARGAMFGYVDPGPELEEIAKALEDDDNASAWGLVASKAHANLIAGSAYGFFGSYIQMGLDVADQQRVKNPFEPPGLAPVDSIIELFRRGLEQGRIPYAADFDQVINRNFSLYRTGKRGIAALGNQTGFEADFIQLEQARRDLQYIRKAARRFAGESGIEATRTSSGRFGLTENTAANREIVNAILIGDGRRAAALVDAELDATQTKEEEIRRKQSIRSAVRARHPVQLGGPASEEEVYLFLDWADERLPASRARFVREVIERYENASYNAGL